MVAYVGDAVLARPRDIGYVAGIVDGEGWFNVSRRGHPSLAVKMTDLDVLERLKRVTGVGNITGPIERPGRKTAWHWTVSRSRDVAALTMTLYPLLCGRRQASAREVLSAWRTMPIGTRGPAACGTASGYSAHLRRGETTCPPCRSAHRTRLSTWRSS